MANNLKESDVAANAMVDALAALANLGYIRIYSSTQPANADSAFDSAAPNDQVLLAELRFGATAFAGAIAGVATANAITQDSSANATGTATWFRVLESDGTTTLWDGSVGAGGTFDLVLTTASIVANAAVAISSLTFTHPKS